MVARSRACRTSSSVIPWRLLLGLGRGDGSETSGRFSLGRDGSTMALPRSRTTASVKRSWLERKGSKSGTAESISAVPKTAVRILAARILYAWIKSFKHASIIIIRETGPERYFGLSIGVSGSGVTSRSTSWCRSVKGKLDDFLRMDFVGSSYDALGLMLVRGEGDRE